MHVSERRKFNINEGTAVQDCPNRLLTVISRMNSYLLLDYICSYLDHAITPVTAGSILLCAPVCWCYSCQNVDLPELRKPLELAAQDFFSLAIYYITCVWKSPSKQVVALQHCPAPLSTS